MSNYPPGVSDSTPDAPWNDVEQPYIDFKATCTITLSRTDTLYLNNYTLDLDEDGDVSAITDEVDAEAEWSEQHYTALDLIEILKNILVSAKEKGTFKYASHYDNVIEECEGWEEDDCEVEIE